MLTIPNDAALVDLVMQLYGPDGSDPTQWDYLGTSDIGYVAAKKVDGVWIVISRGSVTGPDWIENLNAVPIWHPVLGHVHAGFLAGVMAHQADIEALVEPPVIYIGHSRGAAESDIRLGLALHKFGPGAEVFAVAWGKPRAGFKQLADLIGPNARWYANAGDPVCDVPVLFDLYVQPGERIDVAVPPPPDDPWGLVAPHHSELYQAGLHAREQALASASSAQPDPVTDLVKVLRDAIKCNATVNPSDLLPIIEAVEAQKTAMAA